MAARSVGSFGMLIGSISKSLRKKKSLQHNISPTKISSFQIPSGSVLKFSLRAKIPSLKIFFETWHKIHSLEICVYRIPAKNQSLKISRLGSFLECKSERKPKKSPQSPENKIKPFTKSRPSNARYCKNPSNCVMMWFEEKSCSIYQQIVE